MTTETYLSLEDIATRTKLPKKRLHRLYSNKTVRTMRGPGRKRRFHVLDVKKSLNGHGHLLEIPEGPPKPEPIALVAYEVAGVRLGLRTKEEAFDRIAALVPSKISLA